MEYSINVAAHESYSLYLLLRSGAMIVSCSQGSMQVEVINEII